MAASLGSAAGSTGARSTYRRGVPVGAGGPGSGATPWRRVVTTDAWAVTCWEGSPGTGNRPAGQVTSPGWLFFVRARLCDAGPTESNASAGPAGPTGSAGAADLGFRRDRRLVEVVGDG